MGTFKQVRLPRNYQKKISVTVHTPVLLRRYTQRTLPFYWNRTCDICVGPYLRGTESNTCCEGMKWCFQCDFYMYGRCPICQKDELNAPLTCDICFEEGNMMTVRDCTKEECDMKVCQHCSKQGQSYNKTFHFCSMLHYYDFLDELSTRF